MTNLEFETIAEEIIRELPEFFKSKISNIIVVVKAEPTKAQERKLGRLLLGLYEGVSLLDRATNYSGAMPDKITLFQNNIESVCHTEEELRKEVRHVILHEIAHHFGIDDASVVYH